MCDILTFKYTYRVSYMRSNLDGLNNYENYLL